MYQYELDNTIERFIPQIKIAKVRLNSKGFADLLSINLEDTLRINRVKNRINDFDHFEWEDIKKLTNPYEYIYAFNNRKNSNYFRSVTTLRPLSRSFFKMIEIIYDFIPELYDESYLQSDDSLTTLHIAEGPGGFIEAFRYIRKKESKTNIFQQDKVFGITLIDSSQKNIPAWKQSTIFLRNHPEVIISKGFDNTGNIYNINNIIYLANQIIQNTNTLIPNITKKILDINPIIEESSVLISIDHINIPSRRQVNFITADGGFDYSIEYNYQEQASCKLIFSEILTALLCQKPQGDFVCKFFDMNLYFTIELLYLLYICYEKVIIYKPLTSRIANSEKYVICKKFKGIDSLFQNNLIQILKEWNEYENETINQLFDAIPECFITEMKIINKKIIDIQIQNITNTIKLLNNSNKSYDINKNQLKQKNIKMQIDNAISWCEKYNIPFKK
jgi:23S rRNA U2552 (ribose-2'-O)-methylase RlmE/FtsJ